MKKIYVGMSGGVDSSVTAALLKDQGYDVTGVYMKNWAQDLPGFECPWREDLADAKRVAVQLGIPFKIYDFQAEYKDKVVDYLIKAYEEGLTPNPDIMCNQEIKFRLFLDTCLSDGADMIATGHYAVTDGEVLKKAKDDNKDQTYFLYRMTNQAVSKTLMPLGDLNKSQVREIAKEKGLVTASKSESMGICFVGKVGIREFLAEFVDVEPGPIVDHHGKEIGQHDGAIFYTMGQRQGLHVGGGLPYYVVDKDMAKNTVYVTTELDDKRLWRSELKLAKTHWINDAPAPEDDLQIRTRHRADLIDCQVRASGDKAQVSLKKDIRAITPGQSAVLYNGDRVVGGGIIV